MSTYLDFLNHPLSVAHLILQTFTTATSNNKVFLMCLWSFSVVSFNDCLHIAIKCNYFKSSYIVVGYLLSSVLMCHNINIKIYLKWYPESLKKTKRRLDEVIFQSEGRK